jgi:hypothetical protein
VKLVALASLVLVLSFATALADIDTPAGRTSPMGTRPYDGFRVTETVTTFQREIGVPSSWANGLPQTLTIEDGVFNGTPLAQSVPADVQRQANGSAWVNFREYTPHIYIVPADTPLQPVRLCRGSPCHPSWGSEVGALARAMGGLANDAVFDAATGKPTAGTYIGGGVPITDDMLPSPGSDSEMVICQPDWYAKNPDGSMFVMPREDAATNKPLPEQQGRPIRGRCWELWNIRLDPTYDPSRPVSPTNTRWKALWGSRHTGVETSPVTGTNHYEGSRWWSANVLVAGHPDSTVQFSTWGVQASRTPLWNDVVQAEDCAMGELNHAFGIGLRFSRNSKVWPAMSYDGSAPTRPTMQGQRVALPRDLDPPAGLTRFELMVFRALQEYGAIISDTIGGGTADGAMAIRVENSAESCRLLFDGHGPDAQIDDIPWSQTILIESGGASSRNPFPTN